MSAYRLPSDLQADLAWFWNEADSAVGVCSTGDITHRSPPVDRESGVRLRVYEPRRKISRAERGHERQRRIREDVERLWHTLPCKGDEHVNSIDDPVSGVMASGGEPFILDRTPMPQWARRIVSHDRKRSTQVHAALKILSVSPGGPMHALVLYRTYGPACRHPICYGRVGNELAPLVEYTDQVVRLMGPEVTASEAGERALGKGAPDARVSEIRRQCNSLLEAASRAYFAAATAERTEREEQRASRFRALLGAA